MHTPSLWLHDPLLSDKSLIFRSMHTPSLWLHNPLLSDNSQICEHTLLVAPQPLVIRQFTDLWTHPVVLVAPQPLVIRQFTDLCTHPVSGSTTPCYQTIHSCMDLCTHPVCGSWSKAMAWPASGSWPGAGVRAAVSGQVSPPANPCAAMACGESIDLYRLSIHQLQRFPSFKQRAVSQSKQTSKLPNRLLSSGLLFNVKTTG